MEFFLFRQSEKIEDCFFPFHKGRAIFVDYLVKVAHHKNEKKKRRWFSFWLSV